MKPVSQAAPRPDQVLTSWKDIANYLRRDVRTVQRWEQSRGMPVHRLPGRGRNAIYAVQSEIDIWWASSPARQELVEMPPAALALRRPRWRLALAGVSLLALVAVGAWLMARRGEPPVPLKVTPLTSLPGDESLPTLSPDGKRLAFTWVKEGEENNDIYVMDLPSGQPERLTSDPAIDFYAEWSPDGARLAYLRIPVGSERMQVRTIDLRTREDRVVFVSPVTAVEPPPWVMTWTPDSRALVFPTPRSSTVGFGLSRKELATGAETWLTSPPAGVMGDLTPAFSPDGRSMVFLRKLISGDGNLFRLDFKPDGTPAGEPRPLTHEPCCVAAPSWMRNGKEIVFTSWRGGEPRLMRISANGGTPHQDLSASAAAFSRVAPNGWLLFSDSVTLVRILGVDLPGGKPRRLIESSRRDRMPSFSPDGKRIAFGSDRSGSWQIWLCNRDGGSTRQLTKLDGIAASAPDWSPSGDWIAFEGLAADRAAVYLADPRDGRSWPVAAEGSANRLPRWSRDGHHLYFGSNRTGRFETWRSEIEPASGKVIRTDQLTHEGGFSGMESADGRFVYYSKDMTLTSIWRMPAKGGKEEPVLRDFPFNRYPYNLAAGKRGLYFRGRGGEHGVPVYFLPFAGPAVPQLLMSETIMPAPGLAVSPDERLLLLTVFGHGEGDILAIKDFR